METAIAPQPSAKPVTHQRTISSTFIIKDNEQVRMTRLNTGKQERRKSTNQKNIVLHEMMIFCRQNLRLRSNWCH